MKSARVILPLSLILACGTADENPNIRGARAGDDAGAAGAGAAGASVPLRRLSRIEYTNTIDDLVAIAVPAEAAAIKAALAPTLARMPDDSRVTVDGQPRGGCSRRMRTSPMPSRTRSEPCSRAHPPGSPQRSARA